MPPETAPLYFLDHFINSPDDRLELVENRSIYTTALETILLASDSELTRLTPTTFKLVDILAMYLSPDDAETRNEQLTMDLLAGDNDLLLVDSTDLKYDTAKSYVRDVLIPSGPVAVRDFAQLLQLKIALLEISK